MDILTFAETFLDRKNLTDFHRDFFAAYAGESAEQWDERYSSASRSSLEI